MNFNNSLELTQSQKLIITMQLKQSLNILNMSKLELEEEIKRKSTIRSGKKQRSRLGKIY